MNILKYLTMGTITVLKFPFHFLKYFLIGLITIITIIPRYIIIGIKFLFSKKANSTNPEIKKIEKKFIPITILTLSITTYLISIFILTRWYVQSERTKNFTSDFTQTPIIDSANSNTTKDEIIEDTSNQYEDLTNITPAPETPSTNNSNTNPNTQKKVDTNFINVNLTSFTQKNTETVAWLQVNGTKVDYPVVQHSDNDFYLEHDFYKRKTTNGWIFADYRNNFETFDNNTIIYGHNLINDTMFGSIPNILKNKWFNNKNNHYIKLSTKNTNSVWQIFSVYKIEPTTDYLQAKFNSTTTYEEFLNKLKKRSTYNFNTSLNYTDKIITLSTCDDVGTKRVAVHAKLINIESK